MWTAEDWILHGEFCPEGTIRDALEAMRLQLGASLLIEIAVDRTALLRTLIFVTSADNQGGEIESFLRQPDNVHGRRSRLSRLARRIAFPTSNGSSEERATNLQDAVNSLGKWLAESVPRQTLGAESEFVLMSVGHDGAAIRPIVFAVQPRSDRIDHMAMKSLAAMIHATPQAESRRDARWMDHSQVLPRFPAFLTHDYASEQERFASSALDLALRTTSATHAALYLSRANDPTALSLTSHRVFDDSETHANPGLIYPQYLDSTHLSRDNDLADVLERQRTIQRLMGATFRPEFADGQQIDGGCPEILCPIPWVSASPAGPAAGLMVLHRIPGGSSFTSQDLAFTRNVSLRVAIHRNASAAGHIAAAVSLLRRKESEDVGQIGSPAIDSIPSDVARALGRVEPNLRTIAEATNSHSVSLRILMGGPVSSQLPGQVLRQVALYPGEVPFHNRDLTLNDDGVNWKVIRTGRSQVVGDVRKEDHYHPSRDTTRSEVSVPVRGDGCLIGVLNLESPYLDHYAVLVPLIEAFASGVGRTLVDSMTDQSRGTLARALAIDNLGHELGKHVDVAIKNLDSNYSAEIQPARHRLQLARKTIDRVKLTSAAGTVESETFGAIVRRAMVQAAVISFDPLAVVPDDVLGIPCNRSQVTALTEALRSIFDNIKEHGSTSSASPPARLDGQLVQFDGARHISVSIASVNAMELDTRLVADLYRVPVEGTKKTGKRLGAYLAGTGVRAIRGLLNAAISEEDSGTLVTYLVFPVVT